MLQSVKHTCFVLSLPYFRKAKKDPMSLWNTDTEKSLNAFKEGENQEPQTASERVASLKLLRKELKRQ